MPQCAKCTGRIVASLYPYFIKPEQESLVAYYLEKQAKPMSKEEKNYFRFYSQRFVLPELLHT